MILNIRDRIKRNFTKDDFYPYIPYFLFSLFLIYWLRFLFTIEVINSADLNYHILHAIKHKDIWYKSLYSYYNIDSFTGWPTLHFYGFLPYLITVFLSYLFDLFSDNSVRIATHTIIIIGLSSLILSLNYAVRPLINNYIIDTQKKYKLLISLISSFSLCFFCFWFLNKNGAKYGVGSDVIIAKGLYTQLFGWHLLLIYLGLLLRLLYDKKNKYFKYIAIIISLAILTHLITATFIIAVTLFYSLINKNRLFLLKSVILGLFLSSFWLVPFLLLIGDFA